MTGFKYEDLVVAQLLQPRSTTESVRSYDEEDSADHQTPMEGQLIGSE